MGPNCGCSENLRGADRAASKNGEVDDFEPWEREGDVAAEGGLFQNDFCCVNANQLSIPGKRKPAKARLTKKTGAASGEARTPFGANSPPERCVMTPERRKKRALDQGGRTTVTLKKKRRASKKEGEEPGNFGTSGETHQKGRRAVRANSRPPIERGGRNTLAGVVGGGAPIRESLLRVRQKSSMGL